MPDLVGAHSMAPDKGFVKALPGQCGRDSLPNPVRVEHGKLLQRKHILCLTHFLQARMMSVQHGMMQSILDTHTASGWQACDHGKITQLAFQLPLQCSTQWLLEALATVILQWCWPSKLLQYGTRYLKLRSPLVPARPGGPAA